MQWKRIQKLHESTAIVTNMTTDAMQCDRTSCARPGPFNGAHCRADQGFRYTSDDWCNCKCHSSHVPKPPDTRTEPPWPDLDDGIRETVRALWDAGFEPTDSGDGSKAGTMECALEVHHVFMRCAPAVLVSEAERLHELVYDWPRTGDYNGNVIEASYSPNDGIGVLALFGVVAPEA